MLSLNTTLPEKRLPKAPKSAVKVTDAPGLDAGLDCEIDGAQVTGRTVWCASKPIVLVSSKLPSE